MSNIFGFTENELKELGALDTAKEIYRQPNIWIEVLDVIKNNNQNLKRLRRYIELNEDVRIVLSGAGTSAYIGDTSTPYLKKLLNRRVESIATTDIVSNPNDIIEKKTKTILISFARSGNSPESIGAYNLFNEICEDVIQVVITCNKDGKLLKEAITEDKNLILLMPEKSNDKSFAMTSSFTCMLLTSILMFDTGNLNVLKDTVNTLSINAKNILNNCWQEIKELIKQDFEKVVYLGSGFLKGLSNEAALKNLELTSGKVVSISESVLGFRHGPKSIINDKTLIVIFASCNSYTKLYDLDLIKEIYSDNGSHKIWVIGCDDDINIKNSCYKYSCLNDKIISPKVLVSLSYIIFAQIFALMNSIKLGISPDNPRPDGSVNRVVKGVNIYKF